MRLLYVINALDAAGGAEKVPCALACELSVRHGYTLHVAHVWRKPKNVLSEQEAIKMPLTEQLEAAGVTQSWLGKLSDSKWQGVWTAYRALGQVIRDFTPDIVHSHCSRPDLYSVLQRTSAIRIRTLHTEKYSRSYMQEVLMEKLMGRHFAATIALCPSMKARWEEQCGQLKHPFLVVPNPIGQRFFEGSRTRTTAPQPPYKLGIVGRLVEVKGHAYAMEALEKLAEKMPLQLYLAGGGALYDKLKAQAAELQHLKVHFLSSLYEEDLRKLYDKLDLLLISSLYEGFPLVTMEAMATGLPVVGTDVCGVRDILSACGSKPVPVQNGLALTSAVQALLQDTSEYCRLSAAGIQETQKCQVKEVSAAHHELYQQLR